MVLNTYWGGDGDLSTTQVREIVDPRTKWNSSDEPALCIWAFGVTTVMWNTNEWGPLADEIYNRLWPKIKKSDTLDILSRVTLIFSY